MKFVGMVKFLSSIHLLIKTVGIVGRVLFFLFFVRVPLSPPLLLPVSVVRGHARNEGLLPKSIL